MSIYPAHRFSSWFAGTHIEHMIHFSIWLSGSPRGNRFPHFARLAAIKALRGRKPDSNLADDHNSAVLTVTSQSLRGLDTQLPPVLWQHTDWAKPASGTKSSLA